MKLIYVLILLTAGCGKKNYQPVNLPHPSEVSRLNNATDPLILDSTAHLSSSDNIVLVTNGGGELPLDWKIQSSARKHLLQKITASDTSATALPRSVDFYANVSGQQSFWQLIVNNAKFEKAILHSRNKQPQSLPTAPGEIARGRIKLFSIGGDNREVELFKEHYRVIVSRPSADKIYYVHASIPLMRFAEKNLPTILGQLSGWHLINLPHGLNSSISAGASVALVQADATQLRSWSNDELSRITDLRLQPTLVMTPAQSVGRLTLFFPHSTVLQTTTTPGRGYRRMMGMGDVSCDYPIVTSNGYAPFIYSNAAEALQFIKLTSGMGSIVWEVTGELGVSVQLEFINNNETITLTSAANINDFTRVGHIGRGGCRTSSSPENSETRPYSRDNLKAAMFWDDNASE